MQYYQPWAQQDLAYEYAKASGWRINDPNALSLLWGGSKVPPNAVTGFRFVGPLVGLHNTTAPAGKDEAEYQKAGFTRKYAATDVHEDWSDSVTAMVMGEDITDKPAFASRKKVIIRSGIWPRGSKPIKVGKLFGTLENLEEWGVYLGRYAGAEQPTKQGTTIIKPEKRGRVSSASVLPEADEAAIVDADEAGTPEEQEEAPWTYAIESRWHEDEVKEAIALVNSFDSVSQLSSLYEEKGAPVVKDVQSIIAEWPVSIRDGSLLEFLRSAECHGNGLLRLNSEEDEGPLEVPGGALRGDVLVTKDQSLWVATTIDEGKVVEVTGAPATWNENGSPWVLRPSDVLFLWRPSKRLRVWRQGESEEEAKAFIHLTRLWGVEESPAKRALHWSGSFVTEVAAALGKRLRGLLEAEDDAVREYGEAHGLASYKSESLPLEPGDLVRLRGKKWAVVLRAHPLDVLVQGETEGLLNEDRLAAKVLHSVSLKTVTHRWRLTDLREA
jgi:hypothetical protein